MRDAVPAYVALGGNLGDRHANLAAAVARLRALPGLRVVQVSPFYETAAVGGPADQPDYLNAVVAVEAQLTPERLLDRLLWIEAQLGRARSEINAPRVIDLDLLLYGDVARGSPDPVLPHPRMFGRAFVLRPLADLAPDLVPPTQTKTVAELLAALPDQSVRAAAAAPPRRSQELAGLTAVVTGSTSGIGRAIALTFAAAGADVVVHGRRSEAAAEEVAAEVAMSGQRSACVMADLADPAAHAGFVDRVFDAVGPIDVWVNNAGADTLTGDAAGWPFGQKLRALLAVDVTATVVLSRLAGRRMAERGRGVIINNGWDLAEVGMEGDSGQLFAATKSAVTAFTRSLAKTLAPAVRVNAVAPGWVRTAWGEHAGTDWQSRVERETPLARWGLPEDVAAAALWLASPAASFITGQVIRVNGGAL